MDEFDGLVRGDEFDLELESLITAKIDISSFGDNSGEQVSWTSQVDKEVGRVRWTN